MGKGDAIFESYMNYVLSGDGYDFLNRAQAKFDLYKVLSEGIKDDFEDFLAEKHAEQYIGTKDCMIDDFDDWMCDLGADELIEYGNKFHKKCQEKIKEILTHPLDHKEA